MHAHGHVASKLKGADHSNLEAYFLKTHAASEALLRRLIFIGLRRNGVTYKEADNWLNHNDKTPSRGAYETLFDRLYAPSITFQGIMSASHSLSDLWTLWIDFSKIIRNHLAHGIRGYSAEWLTCGLRIDQALIVELDAAVALHLGGSPTQNLSLLSPRLPAGTSGMNIPMLVGAKKGRIAPKASLQSAQSSLERLGLWP